MFLLFHRHTGRHELFVTATALQPIKRRSKRMPGVILHKGRKSNLSGRIIAPFFYLSATKHPIRFFPLMPKKLFLLQLAIIVHLVFEYGRNNMETVHPHPSAVFRHVKVCHPFQDNGDRVSTRIDLIDTGGRHRTGKIVVVILRPLKRLPGVGQFQIAETDGVSQHSISKDVFFLRLQQRGASIIQLIATGCKNRIGTASEIHQINILVRIQHLPT